MIKSSSPKLDRTYTRKDQGGGHRVDRARFKYGKTRPYRRYVIQPQSGEGVNGKIGGVARTSDRIRMQRHPGRHMPALAYLYTRMLAEGGTSQPLPGGDRESRLNILFEFGQIDDGSGKFRDEMKDGDTSTR